MNDEGLSLRYILDWYNWAGVDETVGDVPLSLNPKKTQDVLKRALPKVELSAQKVVADNVDVRKATTDLAQATLDAKHNARELCKKAANLEELKNLVEHFDGCALKLTANKTVFGAGKAHAKIMFVGEAPGADEDRIGEPFVGRSGHLLDKIIQSIALSRDDVYITNVLPWRPPGNRTPTEAEVAVCLPFLKRHIELVSPDVIVLLGGAAANALFDNQESISKLRGKWLEYVLPDERIIPAIATFHPAYLLRNSAQKAKVWSDFLRLKKKIF